MPPFKGQGKHGDNYTGSHVRLENTRNIVVVCFPEFEFEYLVRLPLDSNKACNPLITTKAVILLPLLPHLLLLSQLLLPHRHPPPLLSPPLPAPWQSDHSHKTGAHGIVMSL